MFDRLAFVSFGLLVLFGGVLSSHAQPHPSEPPIHAAGPALVAGGSLTAKSVLEAVGPDRHERIVRDTVALGSGSVSVENKEGSITVSTWNRDAVAYEARIVSEQAPEIVENTVIEAEQFNQRFSLVSNFDDLEARWTFGTELIGYGVLHPEVHYTLTVPRSAELLVDDAESTVEVTGLAAPLRLEAESSSIRVRDQRGPVRVDAQEGAVSLTDVRGDLKVDAPEGRVTVEGLRGRLMLDTHQGTADVAVDSLAAVEVETHKGEVTLTVPREAGFDLATDFGEGAELRGDLDLGSLREDGGNDYAGPVRGGGPLVHLSSQDGVLVLQTQGR